MSPQVLALDASGAPKTWLQVREAVGHYAKGDVMYAVGERGFPIYGGFQRSSGQRSVIRANSIIALSGRNHLITDHKRAPALTKAMLLVRDRHTCAYCGGKFPNRHELDMEHIIPRSRGGAVSWMNLVAACRACNVRKANRNPEEAGMPLLLLPYVPNRHEAFILSGRHILADQTEFLLHSVPKHSRIRA